MMQTSWMCMTTVAAVMGCDAIDLASVRQDVELPNECPPTGCFNSPEIEHDRYGMHEFNVNGLPNLKGVTITSKNGRAQIVKGAESYDLHVENARLRGVHATLPPLEGMALKDAEIRFESPTTSPFVVHIEAVLQSEFAIKPHDPIEGYKLTWHDIAKTPGSPDRSRNVCADLNRITQGEHHWYQFLGLEEGTSVVFEGDRIRGETMTIDETWQPDWFNVACAGTALAKLHVLRETSASLDPRSPLENRRATLKMLTAKYCEEGRAFTMAGEPLFWRSPPRMDYPGANSGSFAPLELEARWTADGAACIATPRLMVTDSQHPFGDLWAAITADCSHLPVCSNTDAWDFDGAILVTANPSP